MSKLSEFERQLRELASSPITKIDIASARGMYIHYTEFDDGDLIGSLKNYLSNVKLKKQRNDLHPI